jgi:hypothetical protein
MQHGPGLASQRAGEVSNHGVDGNHEVESLQARRKCIDIRRAAVECADRGDFGWRDIALERQKLHTRHSQS